MCSDVVMMDRNYIFCSLIMLIQYCSTCGNRASKLSLDSSLSHVLLSAGLLESSMRLKPHEAQSYRKKALWVSWVSIVITLILAVVSFSE